MSQQPKHITDNTMPQNAASGKIRETLNAQDKINAIRAEMTFWGHVASLINRKKTYFF